MLIDKAVVKQWSLSCHFKSNNNGLHKRKTMVNLKENVNFYSYIPCYFKICINQIYTFKLKFLDFLTKM